MLDSYSELLEEFCIDISEILKQIEKDVNGTN